MNGTKKIQKIIGQEEYLNTRTGEVELFDVVKLEERDFDFQKIWLGHLLSALNILGNKKIKVLSWMLKNKNYENKVIATQRKMAKEIGTSVSTITETIKQLIDVDAIKVIQHGVYWLNPELVWKGNYKGRMKVLFEYEKNKDEDSN